MPVDLERCRRRYPLGRVTIGPDSLDGDDPDVSGQDTPAVRSRLGNYDLLLHLKPILKTC